jgi:hypothetical protein
VMIWKAHDQCNMELVTTCLSIQHKLNWRLMYKAPKKALISRGYLVWHIMSPWRTTERLRGSQLLQ